MYIISLLPKAERELYKAWKYYEEEQPGLGKRFSEKFVEKLELIQNDPFHYPIKMDSMKPWSISFPTLLFIRSSNHEI